MSYKPEKHELIDFLYGEVSQEQRARIEAYLEENPEAKKELKELQDVRTIMGAFPDQEVIEPVVMLGSGSSAWDGWKKYIAVAASITALLLTAVLFDVRLNVDNNSLNVSLGEPEKVETVDVSNELLARQDSMYQYMSRLETRLQSISQEEPTPDNDETERLIKQMLDDYKNDNLSAVAELVGNSEEQQKEFIQQLFIAFAREIEYQREEDLELINAGFRALKDETDFRYRETELMLSSMMTGDDTQNNY